MMRALRVVQRYHSDDLSSLAQALIKLSQFCSEEAHNFALKKQERYHVIGKDAACSQRVIVALLQCGIARAWAMWAIVIKRESKAFWCGFCVMI
jgi:hypothetical protein